MIPLPAYGPVYPVYGLHFRGTPAHSVFLRSKEQLDKKGAYKKLSIALALLAMFDEEGLKARANGGIGGYTAGVVNETYAEESYGGFVTSVIQQLKAAEHPFQIQACFTLSRAFALLNDPESAIIEFFKVIELSIKHAAATEQLTYSTAAAVLKGKIFGPSVRDELAQKVGLKAETVDMIFRMKNVRNKFIGHGGVRPVIGELFGDPEGYGRLLEDPAFLYDPYLKYGETFFERVLNDVSLIARLLFCRMQGLAPFISSAPGCWSEPSPHVLEVLRTEGVTWRPFHPSELEPGN